MEQKKFEFTETNFDDKISQNACSCSVPMDMPRVMMCPPIEECPQERVCHKYTCYEVPHIIPCNTKIINHHIYKHTYTPCFTTCEENVCENIYESRC